MFLISNQVESLEKFAQLTAAFGSIFTTNNSPLLQQLFFVRCYENNLVFVVNFCELPKMLQFPLLSQVSTIYIHIQGVLFCFKKRSLLVCADVFEPKKKGKNKINLN